MTAWEYLYLHIEGHNRMLSEANNMLVTTLDGRWDQTRMPKDVIGIVIQLGAEGWEMIGSETWTLKHVSFGAVFKRPKP